MSGFDNRRTKAGRPESTHVRHRPLLQPYPLRNGGQGQMNNRYAAHSWRIRRNSRQGRGVRSVLNFSLLRECECIFYVDAKITNGALDFRMAEENLDGP
jgi:hypothetical protein